MEFPIISVANIHSDFDAVNKKLFDAACQWGFFIITDHGITKAEEISELVSGKSKSLVGPGKTLSKSRTVEGIFRLAVGCQDGKDGGRLCHRLRRWQEVDLVCTMYLQDTFAGPNY